MALTITGAGTEGEYEEQDLKYFGIKANGVAGQQRTKLPVKTCCAK